MAGASTRAWVYRVCQILCLSRKQGLFCQTSARDAGAACFRAATECTSTAWPTATSNGPCREVPSSCTTMRVPAYKRFGTTSEGSLACCERQTLVKMHWCCTWRSCRRTRNVFPKRRRKDHAIRRRTGHRGSRAGCGTGTQRANPIASRH